MKLRLETTQEELLEKGDSLVESLADILGDTQPEISEALYKALALALRKESELKFPVLQGINNRAKAIYKDHVRRMLQDINEILDKAAKEPEVKKSFGLTDVERDNMQLMDVEATSKLDFDIPAGASVYKSAEGKIFLVDCTKSQAVSKLTRKPVKQDPIQREPTGDYTEAAQKKDDVYYTRVKKAVLAKTDYSKTDFLKDGPLFGMSTNQLMDLLRKD